jgi:hypothetical protein
MERYSLKQTWGSFLLYDVINTARTWQEEAYIVAGHLLYTEAVRLTYRLNSGEETA